jgi:acylpyruvate hydrolase
VIGRRVRHASEGDAQQAIAGFTVINDVTGRDWQYRTKQWLQGKTFESSTPIGPWLVTDGADEPVPSFVLSCEVDGDTVQKADTADLVFGPAALVSYISRMMTLEPGDIIATGTPGGVGHARKPPRYLAPGSRLVTRIEGVGELDNLCVAEAALTI